jgi:hypothetical protein
MSVVKRQHYVFRSYLESWAADGPLFCLRSGNVFQTRPADVAVENYFYEPQILEPADIFLLEKAIIDPSPEPAKRVLRNLLDYFITISEIKKLLNQLDPNHPLYSELEAGIINFEENYHGQIEGWLKSALDSMLRGDIDFYFETEKLIDFASALCVQYTRTKKIRKALVAQATPPIQGADIRRMANVLCHMTAVNLAWSIFRERDQFRLTLLENATAVGFITGDQPVINLHANESRSLLHDQFELYYPLSPTKAMALVHFDNHLDRAVTAEAVRCYNA